MPTAKRLSQINLNTLRIAEAAARHANFTRAAEENFITPSAVSQQIRKLEEQLEFPIFQRKRNAVALTTEGQEFIMAVREALDRIVLSHHDVVRRRETNMLKMSVLPTFAVRWLLPRLSRFYENHRDLQIFVSNSYENVDFRKEDYDCAVRFGDGRFPGLVAHPLLYEELMPVCQPALWHSFFPNMNKTDRLELLRHFPLLQSGTCTDYWVQYLAHVKRTDLLTQSPQIFFDSCLLAVEAAAAGMGFAIMNRIYVERDLNEGRLLAPFEQTLPTRRGWYLVYPEGRPESRQLQAFRSWIAAEAHCEVRSAAADAAE